jgi:hypothetical protein
MATKTPKLTESERSFEPISESHLKHLRTIAEGELAALFRRRPNHSGAFRHEMFLLALGQGAASHFVSGGRGIKDFDIWAFFRPVPGKQFPPRSRLKADFGPSLFGRNRSDAMRFLGRRVDILGRDLAVKKGEAPELALQRYLESRPTKTARLLAMQPVVALWPDRLFSKLVWRGESK